MPAARHDDDDDDDLKKAYDLWVDREIEGRKPKMKNRMTLEDFINTQLDRHNRTDINSRQKKLQNSWRRY